MQAALNGLLSGQRQSWRNGVGGSESAV